MPPRSQTSPVESADPSVAALPATEGAAARAPLCFVIDEESSIRHFVSLILQGLGIDTMEFAEGAQFRAACGTHTPDLIILNINLDANDAVMSLETLGKLG